MRVCVRVCVCVFVGTLWGGWMNEIKFLEWKSTQKVYLKIELKLSFKKV